MKRPAAKGDSSPPAKAHSSARFFNIDIDAGDFSDLFNPFKHTSSTNPGGQKGSSTTTGGACGSKVCELEVSLEELLTGVTKHVRLSGSHSQEHVMNVEVKKGWREGTRITFPGAGLKAGGHAAQDIMFVVKEKKHSHFRREGSNLVYTAEITLREVRFSVGFGAEWE